MLGIATNLGACSTTGNEAVRSLSQDVAKEQILPGVTTKTEVTQRFGNANKINRFDSGVEIWSYRSVSPDTAGSGAVSALFGQARATRIHELALQFDREGKVMKFVVRDEVRY